MKNSKLIQFLIPIFLLLPALAFADLNGTQTNGSGGDDLVGLEGNWPNMPPNMPYCFSITPPNNIFGLGISLNLAGLLNGNHPEMIVRYTFDFPDQMVTFVDEVTITNQYLSMVGIFENTIIYGAYIEHYYDLAFICPAPIARGNYTFELMTKNADGDLLPYPIADFNGPGEIFDAEIFGTVNFYAEGSKYFCCDGPKSLTTNGQNNANILSSNKVAVDLSAPNQKLKNRVGTDALTQQRVNVYPNPFSSILTINQNVEKVADIYLILRDITGRVIKEKAFENYSGTIRFNWETDQLPSGVYLLNIKIDGQMYMERLTKI